MWWKYYHLRNEPNLSIDPLKTNDELELFYGRKNELINIATLLSGNSKQSLLLTGNPGVGKSTLINKLFSRENAYVNVKLSKTTFIQDAELYIAEEMIGLTSKYKRAKAKILKERLYNNSSKSTANNIGGTVGIPGLGANVGTTDAVSLTPIRNFEITDLIVEAIDLIPNNTRLHLVLDESDFFDTKFTDELIRLSQRIFPRD